MSKKAKELERKLGIANGAVCKQIEEIGSLNEYIDELEKRNEALRSFIATLERHLEIAEKAIERKDKQFLGLRSAYQDELINKGE